VIFRNSVVPDVPVSYIEAPMDQLLWQQLESACPAETGCSWITIPHNSNLANGRMFTPSGGCHEHGEPVTGEHRRQHARGRLAHEPVIEVFQHKGNSECINGLGAIYGEPDEFCNFEAVRHFGQVRNTPRIGSENGQLTTTQVEVTTRECGDQTGQDGMVGGGCVHETDFLRSNLLVGLSHERQIGVNTAKLGVIASTDTHASTPGATDEQNWGGHVSLEANPQERLRPGLLTSGIEGNPGGLAGVWAVENSRDAIFEALERKEVFGTSGPRIEPRLFASWDYPSGLCERDDRIEFAYAAGVPMGGDLSGEPGDGHDELCAVFVDPDFDDTQPACYYLRAIENPSPRWSLLDCLRIDESERPPVCGADSDTPKIIQEMAWSSPIWYRPASRQIPGGSGPGFGEVGRAAPRYDFALAVALAPSLTRVGRRRYHVVIEDTSGDHLVRCLDYLELGFDLA
jgi:hypothetical protein